MRSSDGYMQLCFGGAHLGLSARRIWEHVALRQVNPFTPLRPNAPVRAEDFVDVIRVETEHTRLTGTTLAEFMAGDVGELAAGSVEQLRANVARPGTQRWLVHVKRSIQTHNRRLSTRNLPAPFLPPGSAYPLGVPGLRYALASWLRDRANEKATGAEWLRRIHNLQGKGLRREELDASGVEPILARQGNQTLTAGNLAAALSYSDWRLSVLPALKYSSEHLRFSSIGETDSIKRVKPKLPRGLESRPLWRDPVLGYWIDVIDWDDLLGEHRGWMAFTCRGEPVTSHDRPGGLCESPEAAVKLANRHAGRVMPKVSTRGRWSSYRLNGGADYREWLVTIPYFRAEYFSGHFEHRNVLLHVRADIRETELDERILVLQEVQSDWAQQARRRTRSERASGRVPEPPWMKEWPALALKLTLLHAAHHGLDGLAWTPGSVQRQRYGKHSSKGLIDLYDRTLPRELNRLLRPHAKQCGRVEVYHPIDFRIEPWVSGYLVSDKEGRQLGVADTWADVQRLLPDGALERLRGMHGVRLDQEDRASILNDGFFAWGMGIR